MLEVTRPTHLRTLLEMAAVAGRVSTPIACLAAAAILLGSAPGTLRAGANDRPAWTKAWPDTDLEQTQVPLTEIRSGGVPRDGIPPIDGPKTVPVEKADLRPKEPVIQLEIGEDARAYPLRVLMWHEIANDVVDGRPVAVTYCPLCNAAVVFDRRVGERTLDFGTSGMLRKSDLVMYDRQTESLWQQFIGQAIVGEFAGSTLDVVPSRIVSWAEFSSSHPDGRVLVPNNPSARPYGRNPYEGYDQAERPFLYRGTTPGGVEPMMYVVAVGERAWSLPLLREKKTVEPGDLRIEWTSGVGSALETDTVGAGRDLGSVIVTREGEAVPHHFTFAFVFFAFHPEGRLDTRTGPVTPSATPAAPPNASSQP